MPVVSATQKTETRKELVESSSTCRATYEMLISKKAEHSILSLQVPKTVLYRRLMSCPVASAAVFSSLTSVHHFV